MGKYMNLVNFLNLRCSLTDSTVNGKGFHLLTSLHAGSPGLMTQSY